MRTSRLAIEDDPIPVMRPLLPAADKILPYLERIDQARYYTNHGPLLVDLERRLAAHFQCTRTSIASAVNGTIALSAALLAVGAAPGKKCLVPAWTFVASAAAIWAANLTPHFVEVSPATWMLDPDALRKRDDLAEVGAVMVISAFGAPVDTASWDRFTADTGIPVIIDGAAAFDSVATVPAAGVGRSPIMISLHATKVFGIGEGAVVLSSDAAFVHRFRQICNFGVWGLPEGQVLGYNGKLSEYHAAVGLASLDAWKQRRAALATLTKKYALRLGKTPHLALPPGFGNGWVSSYANVVTEAPAATIIDRLTYMGIETRRWWRSGVHLQRAYEGFPRDPLPFTEHLAEHVFALPFFHDLTDAQLDRIVSCLSAAMAGPV
jgi:dTDP-4-amino-4,6-dideoxygalactose transaminase